MYVTKENFPLDVNDQSQDVPDEKGARQSKLTPPGVAQEFLFEDAKTLVEVMQRGQRISNNGPCLGWRDSNSPYKWLTFSEVIERSQNLSRGLVHIGMKPGQETFVGIYAQNSVEWVLVEHACYNQSAVLVPLYDTLGPTASKFVLNHVEAEFVVCDTEKKARALLEVNHDIPKLRHIICIHEVGEEVKALAQQRQVAISRLKDVEELGQQNQGSLLLPKPSDLATICFTSGTTGDPKGVMLTHSNLVADACAIIRLMGTSFMAPGDKLISHLPMAHMLDRISQIILYVSGGGVGFFRGDIRLLMEDIEAMKPTVVSTVPRILNKIYDKVQNEVRNSIFKKFLLDTALRAKKAEYESGVIRNNSLWDRLVLKNIRNILGGELKLIVSAGAPIRHEVITFYRHSFGCHVMQGYGQTEGTAASCCTTMGETSGETVGPPLPCNFVKLADVPDMGYFAEKGEGEVLVKGPNVTRGYFKDPEKTAEILDADGWLHTGDIGRWLSNGTLSIIDRKKNLLKLAQGEYISPEKVEAVYLGCPYLEQIYVHGDSLESCLVAVVVPNKDALMAWCSQIGIAGEWKDICENETVKGHILKEMSDLGRENGLKGFEQVKALHLHPEAFSMQNDILTVTMKLKRPVCRKKFQYAIKMMYDSMK